MEKFSELVSLNSLLVSQIELKHEYWDVTANKSKIITLSVLIKDEKKYSDCVDGLDQLEEWTHDMYKVSGLYKETCYLWVHGRNANPTRSTKRPYPTSSETDPLGGIKIPCYGDELTRVRFAGARHLHAGCHTAKQ